LVILQLSIPCIFRIVITSSIYQQKSTYTMQHCVDNNTYISLHMRILLLYWRKKLFYFWWHSENKPKAGHAQRKEGMQMSLPLLKKIIVSSFIKGNVLAEALKVMLGFRWTQFHYPIQMKAWMNENLTVGYLQMAYLYFSSKVLKPTTQTTQILSFVDRASWHNRVKKNQLDAQLIPSIFRLPLYVSGVPRPIFGRYNRIYPTFRTYYSF
jgi:hypothetical protein